MLFQRNRSILRSIPILISLIGDQLREWRDKQAAIVEEKDARSEVKRQETIGAAHEAIDRFYEDYNQKKSKSIAENR